MMEHPQQRAWTMQHPALARVFAVALAVMSVILGFGGFKNYENTLEENEERLRYEDKFAQRIENYVELSARLENSITYDEVWEELEKIVEQHEADASQHKTDLALYSAEKGGNTMGADMIWEAMPQIKGAKAELEAGKQQLAAGEAQMQAVQQLYAANSSDIASLAARAAGAANSAEFSTALANIKAIYTLIEGRPAMPVEPAQVAEPSETLTEPAPVANPGAEPAEGASDEEKAQWQENKAAYDAYHESLKAYNENRAAWTAYNNYRDVELPAYEQAMADYMTGTEYGAWAGGVGAAIAASGAELESLGATVTAISGEAAAYFAMFGADAGSMSADGSGAAADAPDISTMTPEQAKTYFSQTAAALEAQLTAMQAGLNGIAYGLGQIGPGIDAGAAELKAARAQLEAGEEQLKKAEHEMQTQLENIWYNLGELEKDRAELEEDKIRLDEEAESLSKEIMEADELREIENDRVSAKLLLTSVREVNDMYEESDDLVGSAEKYLSGYKADTELMYKGRILVTVLAALGCLAGLAAVPAAYEKLRARAWLIAPVVLCIICSVAAEAVYQYAGLGWWYVGLFTAVIAAIHLIIVLPKAKHPASVTET